MNFSLTHFPDPKKITSNFRIWHVESLLNQAADLTDRCISDYKEYFMLYGNRSSFELEIEYIEKELELQNNRLDFFDREISNVNNQINANLKAQHHQSEIVGAVQAIYDSSGTEGIEHIRDAKTLNEVWQIRDQIISEYGVLQNQLKWAISDKTYYIERKKLNIENLERKKEYSENGGPFDYEVQMKNVFERIERNYNDSFDRAFVAEIGLELIYGYKKTDENKLNLDPKYRLDTNLNNLSLWISTAIEWLVAYRQLDQSVTRVISLFSLLSENDIKRLQASTDDCVLKIKIPETLFESHSNVRLRGIGASFIGNIASIPWSIEARVPQKAIYNREGKRFPINQSKLPQCLLGRVESKSSFRNIEFCGFISLLNASPIAQLRSEGPIENDEDLWTFKIIKPLNSTEKFEEIKDILVELDLTGKPIL